MLFVCLAGGDSECEKCSFSRQNTVLGFSKSSSETLSSPPIMLDIGDDEPDDQPTFQGQVSNP
jgi:hypothetical protein